MTGDDRSIDCLQESATSLLKIILLGVVPEAECASQQKWEVDEIPLWDLVRCYDRVIHNNIDGFATRKCDIMVGTSFVK